MGCTRGSSCSKPNTLCVYRNGTMRCLSLKNSFITLPHSQRSCKARRNIFSGLESTCPKCSLPSLSEVLACQIRGASPCPRLQQTVVCRGFEIHPSARCIRLDGRHSICSTSCQVSIEVAWAVFQKAHRKSWSRLCSLTVTEKIAVHSISRSSTSHESSIEQNRARVVE